MMSAPQLKKLKFLYDENVEYKSSAREFLQPGYRGFLATFNFLEKNCVREAYNVLNQYAHDLYGSQRQVTESTVSGEGETPIGEDIADGQQNESDKVSWNERKVDAKNVECYKISTRDFVAPENRGFLADFDSEREVYKEENEAPVGYDIADDLQKKIGATKVSRKEQKGDANERFQAVDTGAANCIFIRTTLTDPVELSNHMVKHILKTQERKTRYLLRLLPVEVVCHTNLTDITNAASLLFDKHFMEESTFSIVFNEHFNNNVSRKDVIRELATLVKAKNINNSNSHLKEATKTVAVEVVKDFCCISVVEGYLRYKKYNLLKLVKDVGNKTRLLHVKAKRLCDKAKRVRNKVEARKRAYRKQFLPKPPWKMWMEEMCKQRMEEKNKGSKERKTASKSTFS